jgi:hypothetical protein
VTNKYPGCIYKQEILQHLQQITPSDSQKPYAHLAIVKSNFLYTTCYCLVKLSTVPPGSLPPSQAAWIPTAQTHPNGQPDRVRLKPLPLQTPVAP